VVAENQFRSRLFPGGGSQERTRISLLMADKSVPQPHDQNAQQLIRGSRRNISSVQRNDYSRGERQKEMAWSGSWNSNRTAFTGRYTDPDGSIFEGTWTPPAQGSGAGDRVDPPAPATPPLSDYDPYVHGVGPRVDDSDSTHDDARDNARQSRRKTCEPPARPLRSRSVSVSGSGPYSSYPALAAPPNFRPS
jgi:hypothetical protein